MDLNPTLPAVGDTLNLFGITATVTQVTPENDWFWYVTAEAEGRTGETITLYIPTDYRTTDGFHANNLP